MTLVAQHPFPPLLLLSSVARISSHCAQVLVSRLGLSDISDERKTVVRYALSVLEKERELAASEMQGRSITFSANWTVVEKCTKLNLHRMEAFRQVSHHPSPRGCV